MFVWGKCDEVKRIVLLVYDKIMKVSFFKLFCDEDKILVSYEFVIDESMIIFWEWMFGISIEYIRMDFEELMVRRII